MSFSQSRIRTLSVRRGQRRRSACGGQTCRAAVPWPCGRGLAPLARRSSAPSAGRAGAPGPGHRAWGLAAWPCTSPSSELAGRRGENFHALPRSGPQSPGPRVARGARLGSGRRKRGRAATVRSRMAGRHGGGEFRGAGAPAACPRDQRPPSARVPPRKAGSSLSLAAAGPWTVPSSLVHGKCGAQSWGG